MSDRSANSEQRPGADVPGRDVADEVVDAEIVEDDVIDAEVVEEESCVGVADEDAPVVEAPVVEGAAPEPELEPDPLADALRERAEYLELAQRARADFENFKRRAAVQSKESEQRGRTTIARNLLPAIDNLQRALTAAGVDLTDTDHADDLVRGFALVYGELRSALERSGVNAFDPSGSKFDPTMHEAISTTPTEGVEPGTVVQTLEYGYKVDEQVIRPARVVVSG